MLFALDGGLKMLERGARLWSRVGAAPALAAPWSRFVSLAGRARDPLWWLERGVAGQEVRLEPTPCKVVWRSGPTQLRAYQPAQARTRPLLLVYAMVNRPSVLDLLPGRSVVAALLARGVPVYLLDWGKPGRAEADLPLDAFVELTLAGAVEAIVEREGCDALHLLGYCQGGTLSTMYSLFRPERVQSLTLLAAPVDFAAMGPLRRWSAEFDPRAVRGPDGNVPGAFLSTGFAALEPFSAGLRWGSFAARLGRGEVSDAAREHFCAMERWMAEDVDHPGRAYIEFLERFYQQNRLLEQLPALRAPLLTAVGRRDKLVPAAATEAALEATGSPDVARLRCDCGHIGLSVGSRAHRELWPRIVAWLEDHDG